jgi:cytidine deaminase
MKYQLNINYLLFPTTDSLTEIEKGLLEKALSACGDAYAPYSKFKVGASVLLGNGQVIIGSNQENIAYPSGLCAERVALFHCGSNYPNETVEVLCIVAKGDLLPVDRLLSPCGGCRQVMVEVEERQKQPFKVIIVSQDGRVLIFERAKDLLPFVFGSL